MILLKTRFIEYSTINSFIIGVLNKQDEFRSEAWGELKSLKLYVWSFRDTGAFHEAVTNQMLGHFVNAIAPRFMRLTAEFNVRGGIHTSVVVEHRMPGWQASDSNSVP